MESEVQKKHKDSILRCPERGNLCMFINTPDGICRRTPCILDDPDYIALQEQIETNRQRINQKHAESKKPNPEKVLREHIGIKESEARKYYRKNQPKQADRIMQEVLRLQSELRALKGKNDDKQGNSENHQ